MLEDSPRSERQRRSLHRLLHMSHLRCRDKVYCILLASDRPGKGLRFRTSRLSRSSHQRTCSLQFGSFRCSALLCSARCYSGSLREDLKRTWHNPRPSRGVGDSGSSPSSRFGVRRGRASSRRKGWTFLQRVRSRRSLRSRCSCLGFPIGPRIRCLYNFLSRNSSSEMWGFHWIKQRTRPRVCVCVCVGLQPTNGTSCSNKILPNTSSTPLKETDTLKQRF